MTFYIENKIIYKSKSTPLPKDLSENFSLPPKMILVNIDVPPPSFSPDQMLHNVNDECGVCIFP